ncbi:MAG: peptidase M41 [Flavobacteriales bacterium]|nr:peptidase M41 [Flavobacteriales bacterium]|tara:strand:+ start:5814 stop:7811 length:1998 start_codon:yes stop_codon:yes gene_type:complete
MGKQKKSNFPGGIKGFKFKIYWIYAIIFIFFIGLNFIGNEVTKPTNWQKFNQDMLQEGKVEKIVIVNKEKAYIYIKKQYLSEEQFKDVSKKNFGNTPNYGPHYYFEIGSVETFATDLKDAQSSFDNYDIISPYYETRKDVFGDILGWILPLLFFVFIWIFIMKRMSGGAGGGQIFNIGKTKDKLVDKADINVTFKDVAGLEEAKEEITEIVDFLKAPEKYTKLGGKIPRGAMLVGPPGTGKTLLAKAVAGEAKVPFFSLSGSDFVEMFVGVGASRVRDLFKQAKEKAPAIIFIDEIDAIGRARGKNAMTGSNDERENTLNQLLTEMDGFGTNSGVIVMAATNRADVLDKALTRAGRFDRQIFVDLPDLLERKQIFEVHLNPIKLTKNMDVNFLARQTPGFSGADIANVCNEAALIAARKSKNKVEKQDFLDAVDRIIGGLEKKSKIISANEKKTIAYHEAGHATVSWMLEYASPLVKVTIVPRGKSLGAAWYLPEERQLTTTEQMLDEICAAMGGRASEELFFGKISTGALSDLEKVTKQAYAMVSIYGLSSKVGNISYYDSSGQQSGFTKPYSEERAQQIDKEVSKILDEQYARAKKILLEHKDKVEKLGAELLENEVIFKTDLEKIFGVRKWKSYEEEKLINMDKEKISKVKKTINPTKKRNE